MAKKTYQNIKLKQYYNKFNKDWFTSKNLKKKKKEIKQSNGKEKMLAGAGGERENFIFLPLKLFILYRSIAD